LQYAEHPEHKFEGDTGLLERRHVYADSILYIGKEANNIDEEELELRRVQIFIDEESIKQKILELTPEAARKVGIAYRGTLKRIQDKIKRTGNINLNGRFMRKLADKLM